MEVEANMTFRRSSINAPVSSQAYQPTSLHERISVDLAGKYNVDQSITGLSGSDLVIRDGSRIAVVEVKTGDPNLPLPSSTASQMQMLTFDARNKFNAAEVEEVFPVLVTNYQVSPADRQELENQGIKIVEVPSAASIYNPSDFFNSFSDIVGFQQIK
jgi:hypothetical protein